MTSYKGVLVFHSETGTEGGYWAFQDEKFMGLPSDYLMCVDCNRMCKPERALFVKPLDDEWFRETDRICTERGHHVDQAAYPEGSWSYEGLHVLKDGDHITVYLKDDPTQTVWDGKIDLTEFTVFENDIQGLWVHNQQQGVDPQFWMNMFLKEYPVKVETIDGV